MNLALNLNFDLALLRLVGRFWAQTPLKSTLKIMKLIASFFLSLVLWAPAVRAELATGGATGSTSRSGTDSFAVEDSKSSKDAGSTSLLKEHLSEQERQEQLAAEKARIAARLKPADEALLRKLEAAKLKAAGAKDGPDTWVDSVLTPVKEAVQPLKETLDHLSKKDPEADKTLPLPKLPEPVVILSEDQKKRTQIVSILLWEQFIEQAKPWLLGGAVFLLLGIGLVQFMASSRSRPARGGDRRVVKSRRKGRV